MNNSNFGYNCRNNADNCFFNPIFDDKEELSYAKRYQNIFDQDIAEFLSSEYLEHQIEEEFSNKIAALDPQDEYYEARKNSLELQRKKELDSIFSMRKSHQEITKKIHKRQRAKNQGRRKKTKDKVYN